MKKKLHYLWLTPLATFATAGEVTVTAPGPDGVISSTLSLQPGSSASISVPKTAIYKLTDAKINLRATNAYYKWADNKFYTTQPPAVNAYTYDAAEGKFYGRSGNSDNFNQQLTPTSAPTVTAGVTISVNGQTWISASQLLSGNADVIDTGEVPFDQTDLSITDKAVTITVAMSGNAPAVTGSVNLFGSVTKEVPAPVGRLDVGGSVTAAMAGEYPSVSWVISRDGGSTLATGGGGGGDSGGGDSGGGDSGGGDSGGGDNPGSYDDGIPFNGHQNNGHGNNYDGVDVSNPGKGTGGPTGLKNAGLDPSGTVDDEIIRSKLK